MHELIQIVTLTYLKWKRLIIEKANLCKKRDKIYLEAGSLWFLIHQKNKILTQLSLEQWIYQLLIEELYSELSGIPHMSIIHDGGN